MNPNTTWIPMPTDEREPTPLDCALQRSASLVDRPLVHIEQCVEDMIEQGQVAEAVQFVHDAAEWATFKGLEAFAYGAMLLEIRLTEIAKAVKQ